MEIRTRWSRLDAILLASAALAFLPGLVLGYLSSIPPAPIQGPPRAVERFLTPAPTPLPTAALARAEETVRERVDDEAFPGAVLALGNRGLVQRVAAFGRTHWDQDAPAPHPDSTLYDLASLTKVVATTAAVMALVEDRRMDLDAPVRQYLPAFSGGDKDGVTIRHLLTHTAGTRAGLVDPPDAPRQRVLRALLQAPLALPPGQDVLYSDVGFSILWAAAERAAGEPLPRYLERRVWGPAGMHDTRVGVPPGCPRCAPTLHLEEAGEPYRGGSYDELARRMDGIAGHAGAFSTAADLARFAALIANEGRLGNVRVFQKWTVRAFLEPQPGAGTRTLGWEVYCGEGIVDDHQPCEQVYAVGHTGATGTSLWIHPEQRSWVVLLTNRTYLPRHEVDMQKIRRAVYEAAVGEG